MVDTVHTIFIDRAEAGDTSVPMEFSSPISPDHIEVRSGKVVIVNFLKTIAVAEGPDEISLVWDFSGNSHGAAMARHAVARLEGVLMARGWYGHEVVSNDKGYRRQIWRPTKPNYLAM